MPPTILIVDDHEAVRSALRNWLKEKFPSFRIMGMTSGEEALAKIKEVSPHLVIMDFKLPGMDGISATRQIKRVVPSTRIVILPALVCPDPLDVMYALKIRRHVKPVISTAVCPSITTSAD